MAFPDANNPEYADLSKDGMILMFIPAKNVGISNNEKLGTGVNFYLQIDRDIDEYYAELKNKGIEIVVDIKDEPFGIRDLTVNDPDGYQLTFNRPTPRLLSRQTDDYRDVARNDQGPCGNRSKHKKLGGMRPTRPVRGYLEKAFLDGEGDTTYSSEECQCYQ
jgi:hypothetical protein